MSGITYQFEPLSGLVKEPAAGELIREHYEQAGSHKNAIPLAVDWAKLLEYAATGIFRVVTARDRGEFLGYMAWWLYPHLLYGSTPRAIQGPWNLLRLLGPSIRLLETEGVRCIVAHLKIDLPESEIILAYHKRLGFEENDLVLVRAREGEAKCRA